MHICSQGPVDAWFPPRPSVPGGQLFRNEFSGEGLSPGTITFVVAKAARKNEIEAPALRLRPAIRKLAPARLVYPELSQEG